MGSCGEPRASRAATAAHGGRGGAWVRPPGPHNTLDGAGACAGRAGCWEPLAPGSSFCWGPGLQGSTSPSSSWSSTPRRAGRDKCEVSRARTPTPPARAPAIPPTPRTNPAPSRHLAPPTRRLAHLASTSPAFALVCAQEVNLALLPRPGSRSARRGGATAAAPPVRAGRSLGCPGGARSGEGGGVGARRRHLQGGQRWARKGHRTPVVSSFKHCDLFF